MIGKFLRLFLLMAALYGAPMGLFAGVVVGLARGVEAGLTIGLLASLGAGGFFGLAMIACLAPLQVRGVRRTLAALPGEAATLSIWDAAAHEPAQTRVLHFDEPAPAAVGLCYDALKGFAGDESPSVSLAPDGSTVLQVVRRGGWRSIGETVEARVEPGAWAPGARVTLSSRPAVGTTRLDFGRGLENVGRLSEVLRRQTRAAQVSVSADRAAVGCPAAAAPRVSLVAEAGTEPAVLRAGSGRGEIR